jgi:hypothetical protein
MATFQFDVTGFTPQPKSYDPLEPGMYQGMIVDSAIKQTKAGTGEYIELVIQVTDGPQSGRRLWERLNISNPNKTAEEIARTSLAELCLAVGVQKLTETEQLHDIPFRMEVQIDRKDTTRNRIMGYLSASGSRPAAAAAAASPAAAAAPKRAWSK